MTVQRTAAGFIGIGANAAFAKMLATPES